MSTRYVESLVKERDSLAAQVLGLAEKAANEERSLTDTEKSSVTTWRSRVGELDGEIRTWVEQSEAFAKFAQVSAPGAEKREAAKNETTALTLGEQFVRSANYKNYSFHGSSGPWESRAAIVTGTDPGKAFMTPDRGYRLPIPDHQTPLWDTFNSVTVSSNSVEYASYPAAAPLAAVVPEGSPKPEATLTAALVPKTLQTVAHHSIVSRQALEDSAQLRSWIDGELRRGVDDKLESLAAAELTGATLPTGAGATLLEAIRVGMGLVQDAGYRANAVVLNPADWAALDISVMGIAQQVPTAGQSFWGLQPVAASAVAAGTAYVGAFKQGATNFVRNSTSVYISDSHADLFLSNLFVVLAERRALSVITRPEAIVEVSAAVTP